MPLEDSETVDLQPISEGTPGIFESAVHDVRIEFGALSHTGRVRENNEDHYSVVRRTRSREILLTNIDAGDVVLPDDHAHVMVVTDGIGGRGFGELASEFVLRCGWELAGQASSWLMKFEETKWDEICQRIQAYAQRIQQALHEYARLNPKTAGMGTTWTCFYIVGADAVVAHLGDSRGYLFRRGRLRQLTRDHTFAQELLDMGMTESQTAPFKHILTNSFSDRPDAVRTETDHIPLEDGDRLLLCTDGLTDMVPDDEIAATLSEFSEPQAACDELVQRALDHGGKDNVTVVLADVEVRGK